MKLRNVLTACALTAAVLGGAASARAADLITIDWAGGPTETLQLDPTAGQPDAAGSDYVLYSLISDNLGNNGIFFGDAATGGWVGTGPTSGGLVQQSHSDYWTPAFYSGSGLQANLVPGSYTGAYGSVLRIAAVPEPATWAIMLLGVGLLGGWLRIRRRNAGLALAAV